MKLTASEIANALTRDGAVFSRRRWVVVPNVSWGWGLEYEADLIAVSKCRFANEIEIKVSRQDLRGDRLKRKFRQHLLDARIKRFWYAVPTDLLSCATDPEIVPPEFGVIEMWRAGDDILRPRLTRRARDRSNARQVTPDEIAKLMHLGLMRYWDLRLLNGGSA